MNKQLKTLKKAFKKLGVETRYDSHSDGSGEWLDVHIPNKAGDKKVIATFHADGDLDVFKTKKVWSDDFEKRII